MSNKLTDALSEMVNNEDKVLVTMTSGQEISLKEIIECSEDIVIAINFYENKVVINPAQIVSFRKSTQPSVGFL